VLCIVTAAVCASVLPGETVAPLSSEMLAWAKTLPLSCAPPLIVAELPTCQYTLHAFPPPIMVVETFGEIGREPICEALRSGRLYASSGVALRRIRVERRRFTVWVDSPLHAVEFLASAGQVLASVAGDSLVADPDGFAASYSLRGGETYVRVVVKAPDGTAAWTQAYYTNP